MNGIMSNLPNVQGLTLSQYPNDLIEKVFANIAEGIMITDCQKNRDGECSI